MSAPVLARSKTTHSHIFTILICWNTHRPRLSLYPCSLFHYSVNIVAMSLALAALLLFWSVPSSAASHQVRFSPHNKKLRCLCSWSTIRIHFFPPSPSCHLVSSISTSLHLVDWWNWLWVWCYLFGVRIILNSISCFLISLTANFVL